METILYHIEHGVATITLNRPDVKNALNETLHKELYHVWEQARTNDEVKIIILTGTENAFSSGADLKSIPIESLNHFDHSDYLKRTFNKLIPLMDKTDKPTIAYINGIAVGAGLSLTLACDFRFADSDAKLALSFLKIGLAPDAGSSYYLPRILGLGKAIELSLGEPITAEEAYRIGLITQIGEPYEFIEKIKKVPQPAYSAMKAMMKSGLNGSLQDVLDREAEYQYLAGKSQAHSEAINNFLRKS
ncbi:enoyl-CoA hydratase-related protein [Salipaludibacillus sp. LMS25]|jgi:2-(1,2-epoxy-1,2-dihydrophenyl)acetyl-CoA isomerase|uniref:enoyl-CoA hydratase/isomerase family protein n=1 Tax=Salipaludibacillus sp. LMS25 TaxID=2924031 RepID=UPI0020D11BE3|nr:enoyl-CoA hydratase-related protein [Salipaludibacillus sp. LMS25]UTR16327.1 enoyl-CoA hydratase-related protein [Salipaludibacillus sp. LMS25]